jgi:hypothetical protein
MCHRTFRDQIQRQEIPDQPIEIPTFFCQRGVAFLHRSTRNILCETCFSWLPRRVRKERIRVAKHSTTISGYYIGLICHSCRGHLTTIRPGLDCVGCRRKYLEFMVQAAAENLVLTDIIELTVERVVIPMDS